MITAETLHAIIAHRSDGRPLTLEAGIVRVADALDMAKGRSRITFAAGWWAHPEPDHACFLV